MYLKYDNATAWHIKHSIAKMFIWTWNYFAGNDI